MSVSAEGRVEHQKLNKTTALLLFGWVFGVQLDSLEKSVLANDEKRVDFIPTFLAKKGGGADLAWNQPYSKF